jgi:hypothetical protein
MSVPVTHCMAKVCTIVIREYAPVTVPAVLAFAGALTITGLTLGLARRWPPLRLAGYALALPGCLLSGTQDLLWHQWWFTLAAWALAVWVFLSIREMRAQFR